MRVVVSGGFDPLHPGHLNLFQYAEEISRDLVVVVNSDEWVSKKHSVLQNQNDRAKVVAAVLGVTRVYLSKSEDGSISEALKNIHPDIFLVGPDHSNIEELPEYETCKKLGIKIVCANHLTKDQGSSIILKDRLWANPPVAVSGLICDHRRRILVGTRRDGGKLCLPGGFLEVGETLEDGLKREIREELNTEIIRCNYFGSRIGIYEDGRKITCVDFTIECSVDPTPSTELSELRYLDFAGCFKLRSQFFTASDLETISDFL